jgi:thiamine kinase-like enzyme
VSKLLTAGDAIALIPGLEADNVTVSELHGGLTNRTFKVISGDNTFVLRLDAEHTRHFNLDRIVESTIVREASAEGLAPELVYADPENGIQLSRYLQGSAWLSGDVVDPDNIDALCDLLRRVHALPVSGVRFDAASIARRYAANLADRQDLHTFAVHCEEIVASVPVTETIVCCHNDVVAQNVIATPALILVDWEYACDNDPLFELASLIGYHNLDAEIAERLLISYNGCADAALRERLGGQIRVYDAIQWLWFANRHRLSPNGQQAARLDALQQRIR